MAVLGDGAANVPDTVSNENGFQVVFQGMSHAGLPAVLHAQRKPDETIDIGAVRVDETDLQAIRDDSRSNVVELSDVDDSDCLIHYNWRSDCFRSSPMSIP